MRITYLFILVKEFRRNLSTNDFGENAVSFRHFWRVTEPHPWCIVSFKGEAEAGSGVGCFGIASGGEVFGKVSFSFNKISAGEKKEGPS